MTWHGFGVHRKNLVLAEWHFVYNRRRLHSNRRRLPPKFHRLELCRFC